MSTLKEAISTDLSVAIGQLKVGLLQGVDLLAAQAKEYNYANVAHIADVVLRTSRDLMAIKTFKDLWDDEVASDAAFGNLVGTTLSLAANKRPEAEAFSRFAMIVRQVVNSAQAYIDQGLDPEAAVQRAKEDMSPKPVPGPEQADAQTQEQRPPFRPTGSGAPRRSSVILDAAGDPAITE